MNKITLFLLLLLFSGVADARNSIRELFLSLPASVLPNLEEDDRSALFELHQPGDTARVTDALGTSCELSDLQDDYLKIEMGENTMELVRLRMANDSPLICLIRTVCAPACDSELIFFSANWTRLDPSPFITPVGKDWFLAESDGEKAAAEGPLRLPAITLMRFSYEPRTRELSQEYTTPACLVPEERQKVVSALKNIPRVYKWTGLRFE